MRKGLSKAGLISEIAATTGQPKVQVGAVLRELAAISYREARNGFIVPGICKLSVVRRKARRCRIPTTGQLVQIGERDALKVAPLGVAKAAVAPRRPDLIEVVEESAAPQATPAPASSAEPPPSDERATDSSSIVFPCAECGAMVSAPPTSAGKSGECPFCHAAMTIPLRQTASPVETTAEESSSGGGSQVDDFLTFVCQECGQEIEAATSMAGLKASCPTCGSPLSVPASSMAPAPAVDASETEGASQNASSMTMRIDLSDLE